MATKRRKKKKEISIRPSSLPLLSCCGASYSYLSESYGSRLTNLGRAIHAALFQKAKEGDYDIAFYKEAYGLNEVETKDLYYLVGGAELNIPTSALLEKKIEIKIETPGFNINLTGTPDIVILPNEETPHYQIIDYKTGRISVSAKSEQLRAYAFLATKGGQNSCSVSIVNVRKKEIDTQFYDADEISAYKDVLIKVAGSALNKNDYCKGTHCDTLFCAGRYGGCPAYVQEFRALSKLKFVKVGRKKVLEITPDLLGKFYTVAKTMSTIAEAVEAKAKIYVDENGQLECGDKILTKSGAYRDEIAVGKAIPILREFFSDNWVECASISKSKLITLCKEQKKKVAEVLETLEDANCINQKHITKYKLTPKGDAK